MRFLRLQDLCFFGVIYPDGSLVVIMVLVLLCCLFGCLFGGFSWWIGRIGFFLSLWGLLLLVDKFELISKASNATTFCIGQRFSDVLPGQLCGAQTSLSFCFLSSLSSVLKA